MILTSHLTTPSLDLEVEPTKIDDFQHISVSYKKCFRKSVSEGV